MTLSVIGIKISKVNYSLAVEQISSWAHSKSSRYICIANVHVLMESYDSVEFRKIVNSADLVTPDGMPLVWMMRLKGKRDQQRVYGPTLMLLALEAAAEKGIPVGFYGGTPRVLHSLIVQMQAQFEGLNVPYFKSPPFGELSTLEDENVVEEINRSGARILFVGLGCPKQEIWMAVHRGRVKAVMLGVGAAFDFHAGVKPQAPALLQNIGMEWLFRLITEPRRLWKRYLLHNPRFVALAVADLLGLMKKAD